MDFGPLAALSTKGSRRVDFNKDTMTKVASTIGRLEADRIDALRERLVFVGQAFHLTEDRYAHSRPAKVRRNHRKILKLLQELEVEFCSEDYMLRDLALTNVIQISRHYDSWYWLGSGRSTWIVQPKNSNDQALPINQMFADVSGISRLKIIYEVIEKGIEADRGGKKKDLKREILIMDLMRTYEDFSGDNAGNKFTYHRKDKCYDSPFLRFVAEVLPIIDSEFKFTNSSLGNLIYRLLVRTKRLPKS